LRNGNVKPADRLSFCLFIVVILHAAVVLLVSFDMQPRRPIPKTVEVTLAQFDDSATPPEEADFLAQANQQGSGTLEEKRELTTTTPPEVRAEELREVDVAAQPPAEEQQQAVETTQLVTSTRSDTPAPPEPEELEQKEAEPEPRLNTSKLLQRSREIASLEAKLAEQQNAYAKRPRVTRITSASTRQTASAFYMDAWRRKLERLGNLNYPAEARRRNLEGRVRVLTSIQADGELLAVEILESSGHQVLDDTVLRIVKMASPFAPFSEAMRKETDILEIIRTFDFREEVSSS
tara:strand:+ start:60901 stop:61776 length:876 start_codon:yes stop_codon:yes gene_type:complete